MPESKPRARVLVVDDDEAVRFYLKAVLTKAGCEAEVFADGVEAVAALEEGRRFDLIITDFMMARSTGLEVLQAAERLLPKARRVLMSASLVDAEMREKVQAHVHEIIIKPAGVDAIFALLERMLSVPS